MSSIFSTQKRHTFLRRKYCFFAVASALSPPVGRCEAAIGRPPFCSAIVLLLSVSDYAGVSGVPGTGGGGSAGIAGEATAAALGVGAAGLRAARFSRSLRRFSSHFMRSSIRTVRISTLGQPRAAGALLPLPSPVL